MKRMILKLASLLTLGATLATASASHAVLLTYDISSPDDLTNIAVGQSVHFDVFLPGISTETWDDTAIFNARALASDTTLWDVPQNVVLNAALQASTTLDPGHVGFLHVDTPLTMPTDFVMSFDIVAVAAGTGAFTMAGADVFEVTGQDATFTASDSIDFNIIAAAVPEPGLLSLMGLGVLGLLATRRRLTLAPARSVVASGAAGAGQHDVPGSR